MKRILVLFAVLAMTQAASGGVIDLWITSLDGAPITPTKEITVTPSQTVDFDIVYSGTAAEGTLFSLDVDVTATGPGTITLANLTEGDNAWVVGYTMNNAIPGGFNFVRVNDAGGSDGEPPLLVLDHIDLHCDDLGTVIVDIIENGGMGGTMTVDGSFVPILAPPSFGAPLVITQVPEPATIALLGLGALLLRRRK